jgi:hypothetical protein
MSARLFAALALVLAACEPEDVVAEDEQVARDALAGFGGSSAQLGLYDELLGPVDLTGVALALAPKQVIAQVQAGLDGDLADPACLVLLTDQQTFIDMTFSKCRYKKVTLDGRLRIDLSTETGTCDGAPCVVATRYTTTLTELRIGKTVVHAGDSELRVPERKVEPRTYTAAAELTDAAGHTVTLRHEIAWTRADGCVDAELGAEFDVDGRRLGVGATGVVVCGDTCPRAGEVHIAWGAGGALSWGFTGERDVLVHGPHGRSFVVEQDCEVSVP